MKLATRISLFFLAALAFVLIGFSGSIYWLVQSHLYYQLDDNSSDALDSLAAAVESGPNGLEWDKSDRHLVIGQSGGGDPINWGVFDNKGGRLDGSDESTIPLLKRGQTLDEGAAQVQDTNWNGAAWRIIHREVRRCIAGSTCLKCEVDDGRANFKGISVFVFGSWCAHGSCNSSIANVRNGACRAISFDLVVGSILRTLAMPQRLGSSYPYGRVNGHDICRGFESTIDHSCQWG